MAKHVQLTQLGVSQVFVVAFTIAAMYILYIQANKTYLCILSQELPVTRRYNFSFFPSKYCCMQPESLVASCPAKFSTLINRLLVRLTL